MSSLPAQLGPASEYLWLSDPRCADPHLVGGKVANLSRFANRYSVPPGFCLPVTAFSDFAITRTPAVTLPPALKEVIERGYAQLGDSCGSTSPPVAVRSSAVDEDGVQASFAGQHDTYLNVAGTDEVIRGVEDCLASAANERAVAYRRRHGITTAGVGIAVLVQQLVPADVSIVAFSADPVTSERDVVVINATWGLGESLVSGLVTPDTFVLEKQGLQLRSERIGEKASMMIRTPGGTRPVDVPRLMRTSRTLTGHQAREVAELVVSLEREVGWPVDVEGAYRGSHLFLLQCRPITTLRQG